MTCADAATWDAGSRSINHPPNTRAPAIAPVTPVVARSAADLLAPKATAMAAAWLSTMRPAEAARKKIAKSFQNVDRSLLSRSAGREAGGRLLFTRATP